MRAPVVAWAGGAGGGPTRRWTRRRKSSPRAGYPPSGYQSKLAHPGDSSTTSPGRAAPAARSTASAIEPARTTGAAPANVAAITSAAWPMATTVRSRSGSAAIGARSRPLFSPPAISTTWSKARMATDAACGVVALESLYQRTPSASPTSSMRCGGPTNDARPAATASGPTSPVSSTSAAAARPLVRSWGRARPQRGDGAELALRADEHGVGARPDDAVVGAGGAERDVAGRRRGEVGHHDGVGGEADGDVVGPLLAEDAGLGRRVGVHRDVPVEVVGGQVEPGRGVAAERPGPGQPEARALDDERVDVEVERLDERDVGVAGGHRAHAAGGAASRPPTASWSSCRRCR